MSTISSFQPFTSSSIYKPNNLKSPQQKIQSFAVHFHKNANLTHNFTHLKLTHNSKLRILKSAEEDAQIPENTDTVIAQEEEEASPEQTVAIPVSPSDKLLMYFQAEGTLSDSAIPNVTQALESVIGHHTL